MTITKLNGSVAANPVRRTLRGALPALAAFAVAGGLLVPGMAGGVQAQDKPAEGTAAAAPAASPEASFSASQKSEIGRIVKEYLLANPEVLIDVQSALESKMEQIQAERLKGALATHADMLYRDPDAPVAGNPKGDVTVIEFFDYNCGYCKRGFPDVAKLIEADKNVKVVFRELPILSKGSEDAARVALAARLQGKYWEFHSAMINFKGQADEASALKLADKVGLNVAKIKTDMKSPAIDNEIRKVRELAQALGINGTPHFVVGNRSIPGAPQDLFEQLKSDVAKVRASGCTYC